MDDKLSILILEDELPDAELIEHSLSEAGMHFSTTHACDRDEFEAAVLQHSFAVILADNSLPQFSSFDALLFLREKNIDTPFILVTGTVSEEFAVNIIHQGADDYILKTNLTRLPSAIRHAIDKKKARQEKQQMEAELIKSETRYRTLFQRNLAGVYQSTLDGKIIVCNSAFYHMLGYDSAEQLQKAGMQNLYYSKKDQDEFRAQLQKTKYLSNYEGIMRRKNGDTLYTIENVSLLPDKSSGNTLIEGIVIDISERKRAENDLKQVNHELHELSSHLQHIREEERIQIARDIHDELGQQLTGLKMDIHALGKKLKTDDTAIQQLMGDIMHLTEDIVTSVRRISANLRPNTLDDLGLIAALEWHSREVETRFEIKVRFESGMAEINLPEGVSTGLFRIYQEALTNAVRHANANLIRSSLQMAGHQLVLEITDDGRGIAASTDPKRKSFGLLGIKERVFVLGGSYELKSAPGKGTSLRVSVPLKTVYQP